MTPSEEMICAAIRGDVISWPLSDENGFEKILAAAYHHDVHFILFDTLRKSPTWSEWPVRLREKLEHGVATASTLDLIGEQEVRRVLIRLDECGIRPLLMKGVPLAYTLYRSPTLRPRGDTDLLIRDGELQLVARVLRELGYDGPDAQTELLTSYECLYRRRDPLGVDHFLDLHWRVNNAQLFAGTFTFDELFADAIEISSLAPCALGLGRSHALLLACMHRFAHVHAPFYVNGGTSYAGDHLRWVYDIHLLSSALSAAEWSDFVAWAKTKNIAEFCLDGLNAANVAFNTQIPTEAMDALERAAQSEPVNVQKLRTSEAAWLYANLRALPNLRQRIAFIKQTALPPPSYMMDKYQTNNPLRLPFLYGHRLVTGITKRLKRSRGG